MGLDTDRQSMKRTRSFTMLIEVVVELFSTGQGTFREKLVNAIGLEKVRIVQMHQNDSL
jgi:hypothetical protein